MRNEKDKETNQRCIEKAINVDGEWVVRPSRSQNHIPISQLSSKHEEIDQGLFITIPPFLSSIPSAHFHPRFNALCSFSRYNLFFLLSDFLYLSHSLSFRNTNDIAAV